MVSPCRIRRRGRNRLTDIIDTGRTAGVRNAPELWRSGNISVEASSRRGSVT